MVDMVSLWVAGWPRWICVEQRKMKRDRILKHMTQPSYWPSSSASRKETSSRSCALDIIDMNMKYTTVNGEWS